MANIISEKDYNKAVALLGREKPRTPFTIKTRCANGSPQTLVADPVFLEESIWKPFPSFIWLVCPRLKSLVADLEQQGLVRFYSQKMKEDAAFFKKFLVGQYEIAEYRSKLAREIYGGVLPLHIADVLINTSVAGSRDFYGVKCLHAHLAQHLAFGNNIIGEEILQRIGQCQEKDNCGKEFDGEMS